VQVRRPHVPVSRSPALWWQHAGQAIIADCRRRYPIRKMEHAIEVCAGLLSSLNVIHS